MTQRSLWLCLLMMVSTWAVAGPTVVQPLPFDHPQHAATFDRFDVACVDCHPVGLAGQPLMETPIPPPISSCHGCHLGEVKGAPRRAASTCETCHDVRLELLPTDHGLGWLQSHGDQGRAFRGLCKDCHAANQCTECHDQRGALTRSPHPPGFTSLHGVEARLDPNSCVECHVADTCTSCHVDGNRPW
jgi:hypothetical protein